MATEQQVRASFAKQSIMGLIGADLETVADGHVAISLPYRHDLCQQNGFLHAGIVTTIADSAGGYAGWTMMPEGAGVLAIDIQMQFMRPAVGERFVAEGRVVKPGKRVTFTRLEVWAERGEQRVLVATGMQTLAVMADPAGPN